VLSLSKHRPSLRRCKKERPFDKLRANGSYLTHDALDPDPNIFIRHPGEGRDLIGAFGREVEIPAFAGMTMKWEGGPRILASWRADRKPWNSVIVSVIISA